MHHTDQDQAEAAVPFSSSLLWQQLWSQRLLVAMQDLSGSSPGVAASHVHPVYAAELVCGLSFPTIAVVYSFFTPSHFLSSTAVFFRAD